MRYLLSSMLLVALTCVAAVAVRAEEPKKIRILLTYGGHGFDEKEFYAIFDKMEGVRYTKVQLPNEVGSLKQDPNDPYAVIVRYDMFNGKNKDEEKAIQGAFEGLLETGVGLVSMHHNLGAHGGWDKYRKIIGGKFNLKKSVIDGKEYNVSGWKHDEHMKIQVVDKAHPITQGIADFEILDETYKGYYVAPGVHLLLKTDHPNNTPELAWTTKCGKSRVVYLMLGHDAKAYENSNFVKLVRQGIVWAAGK